MPQSKNRSGMMHLMTGVKSPLQRHRLYPVYEAALRLWGDRESADWFLDQAHPLLGGRTPREVALESEEGAALVVQMIGQAEAGVAV